jgi:hypothetical protein
MSEQWPSEDEDFDAIMDAQPARPTAVATRPDRSKKAISVSEPAPARREEVEEAVPVQATPEVDSDQVDEVEAPADSVAKAVPIQTVESEAPAEPAIDPLHEAGVVPPAAAEPSKPAKTGGGGRSRKLILAHIVLEILLVVVIAALAVYANNLQSERTDLKTQVAKLNNDPTLVAKRQSDDIVKKVGALMQLPSGETPTIANVSDAAKAREQSPFFKEAQNNDKVLMYVNAKQAILYRPSTNKIVLVAPLSLTNDQAATSTSQTTTKTTR